MGMCMILSIKLFRIHRHMVSCTVEPMLLTRHCTEWIESTDIGHLNCVCAGFENAGVGCCATGLFEMGYMCNNRNLFTCSDASKYVFWDAFHPTDKMSQIVANSVMEKNLIGFLRAWYLIVWVLWVFCLYHLVSLVSHWIIPRVKGGKSILMEKNLDEKTIKMKLWY